MVVIRFEEKPLLFLEACWFYNLPSLVASDGCGCNSKENERNLLDMNAKKSTYAYGIIIIFLLCKKNLYEKSSFPCISHHFKNPLLHFNGSPLPLVINLGNGSILFPNVFWLVLFQVCSSMTLATTMSWLSDICFMSSVPRGRSEGSGLVRVDRQFWVSVLRFTKNWISSKPSFFCFLS